MLGRGPSAALVGGGAFGPRGRYLPSENPRLLGFTVDRPAERLRLRLYTGSAGSWKGDGLPDDAPRAESQLSELRNMRVLLEEARGLARDLAYHRRARLEDVIGRALDEVDRQIEELRKEGRG